MGRLIFGLMPWWVYAAAALLLGWVTFAFFEDYQSNQREAALARVLGAPETVMVRDYVIGRTPQALGEVRVSGLLRADLGIVETGEDTSRRTYLILGGENRRGPLIALQATTANAEDMIEQVVSSADANGRVEVSGFVTNAYKSDLASALRQRGATVAPEIIQPYFGPRDAAIAAKVDNALVSVYVGAALTALMGLLSAFKFWRWRSRVAARNPSVPIAAPAQRTRKAPAEAKPMRPARAMKPALNAAPASPWGGGSRIAAAQGVPPQAQSQAQTQPLPQPLSQPEDPIPTVLPTRAPLPGSQTGHRFKTPEEIVLKTFGKVTRANLPSGQDRE